MGTNHKRKLSSCPSCSSERALELIEKRLHKCRDCGTIFKFENGDWKEVTE